jgi:hypothetical protein
LTTKGQTLAVANTPVTAQIYQALNIQRDLTSQISFNFKVTFDDFS